LANRTASAHNFIVLFLLSLDGLFFLVWADFVSSDAECCCFSQSTVSSSRVCCLFNPVAGKGEETLHFLTTEHSKAPHDFEEVINITRWPSVVKDSSTEAS